MRILIIVNVFHPDRAGGAAVFTDLALGLADRGHHVEVWSAYPYYPEWQDKSGENRWRPTRTAHRGVTVVRHWLWIPQNPASTWQRLIYEGSFALSIMRRRGWRDFDVVLAFVPLLGGAAAAVVRARVAGVPVILDIQDLPAEAAAASALAGRTVAAVFARIQSLVFRQANSMIAISPVMADRITATASVPPPTVIPNWLNYTAEKTIKRLRNRGSMFDSQRPRILYAGNLGEKQGLDLLIERLGTSDLTFEFAVFGEGSARSRIKKLIEGMHDPRFVLGPFLSEAEFLGELSRSQWLVIPERDNRGASFIPSKLIPAISLGVPILAITTQDSPLGTEVNKHRIGVVVDWSEVVTGISAILDDAAGFTAACLKRAKAYTRRAGISAVEMLLAGQLLGDPSNR